MRHFMGLVQRMLSITWLSCFQVSPPVLLPEYRDCAAVLMEHTFAFSYGHPFVGMYKPPECDYDTVAFNLTVTSAGRQFDRLGVVYLGDTEIFRTSTAEPTQTGIIWTYIKDMTPYLSLFMQPQTLTFDLGNLVDDTYTGVFNTTLTATFYISGTKNPPADVIISIGRKATARNETGPHHVGRSEAAKTLTLPKNVKKAIFSISAVGQMAEEFWWSNVLDSNAETFPQTGSLYGRSPFRELQLRIDGSLAGVSSPFPVIFTGGIAPGFWRPIVGIDAFDLIEDEIDLTPWLGTLCDGHPHEFGLRVVGLSDDGHGKATLTDHLGSYWVVSGKIFLWLDVEGSRTLGAPPELSQPPPRISLSSKVTTDSNGTNTTLDYHVYIHRSFSSAATIFTSEGEQLASWEQSIDFSAAGHMSDHGHAQVTKQISSGYERSSSGYARSFFYPLWVDSHYAIDQGSGNLTIRAKLDRTKQVSISGHGIFLNGPRSSPSEGSHDRIEHERFPGTILYSRQNGSASYRSSPAESRSFSDGATEHQLRFIAASSQPAIIASPNDRQLVIDHVESPANLDDGVRSRPADVLYQRHVLAVNGSVVFDRDHIRGESPDSGDATEQVSSGSEEGLVFTDRSAQSLLGRGPSGM